ncbi:MULTISPECIES: YciE/YciF ferroxidase family protein [Hymenobacter]|uniref:Ferritin-like domain-containing protein n=2 Tax=Hymenobacter TaxID=89966 RepID=A0A8T9QG76_9BACT|nr:MULTISPECIES: ferritin-like domain-containing protein [Hymenobacter]UOQ55322.1 ferritin-like domain-containing protein [Hymenobacter cellulosivorans]UOQ74569.1 ferritin-like domain-containing protein [Hymenobacter cellulosilyticus]
MSDKLKSLDDLFQEQLRDLYSAETQLTKALPDMAKEARDPRLQQAFDQHLIETKNQVARLEQIGRGLGLELSGHTCKAMQGLVAEGKETIAEDATDEVKDAALIAAAQRVEHYEIAGYGTAAHYALRLGHTESAELLRQTLQEEQATDTLLNNLAKNYINAKAM